MRKSVLCWLCIFISLALPVLACGSLAGRQVTPTPTKTPRRIKLLPESPVATPTLALLPTITATPEVPVDTPTPIPPPDTPTPELPPTDTAAPEPTPTDVPPPPPPTNTPPPPPPTNTPAPPPPTAPPVNQGPDVVVELPDGNTFDTGEKVKMVFIVRDPDGVSSFSWGIFTQNETPLMGGDKKCNGAVECREEKKVDAPVPGTYIIGADAVDVKGNTSRGIGEIYVR